MYHMLKMSSISFYIDTLFSNKLNKKQKSGINSSIPCFMVKEGSLPFTYPITFAGIPATMLVKRKEKNIDVTNATIIG